MAETLVLDIDYNISKAEAKNELLNYKDMNSYRQAQQNEIKALIDNASKKIDGAESIEEVNNIVTEIKASLDKIETDDQLAKEESLSENDREQVADKNGNTENISVEKTPKTGDELNYLLWSFVVIVAFSGAITLFVKRNTLKNNKYLL